MPLHLLELETKLDSRICIEKARVAVEKDGVATGKVEVAVRKPDLLADPKLDVDRSMQIAGWWVAAIQAKACVVGQINSGRGDIRAVQVEERRLGRGGRT
ncbi:hypothetical protein CR513_51755, partial [Mucuna pruriens]